jgi:hypothetical protein
MNVYSRRDFGKACARVIAGRQPDRSDECRSRFSGETEFSLGAYGKNALLT